MINENQNWLKRNLSNRNLIKTTNEKSSYLRIFGFVLIIMGVIYMASFLLPSPLNNEKLGVTLDDFPNAVGMAISFFFVMLGAAFCFPSLLEGNDGLSTMRIVVFMMVNVICFLLIKIGWDAKSLADIGLNEYWMGVIAFIFGAKATQSYFESRLAAPRTEKASMKTTLFDSLTDLLKRKTFTEKEIEINNRLLDLITEETETSKIQKDTLKKKLEELAEELKTLDEQISKIKNSLV